MRIIRRIPQLMGECVHCGFCLPACPTYALWQEEMDSPRGRIYLMKAAAEGKISAMDESFVQHFDRCLGCMSCMTACPSGVKYDKLIESTRAQIERHHRRSLWDRFTRWMIFQLFPHPRRLRWLSLPLWIYQRSGLRRLFTRRAQFACCQNACSRWIRCCRPCTVLCRDFTIPRASRRPALRG